MKNKKKENCVFYLSKNGVFIPYKTWLYNEYVEKFIVINVSGGTRLYFASSARFKHDDIISFAKKKFFNLVMPPIITGIAFKGIVIKDLCCFLHDKEVDTFCFKSETKEELEKKFNLSIEVFGFKTITSPKNFIP